MSCLVVYNTKENIDFLVKNWDALSKFSRDFSMFFVNPFSRTEKRWAIYPMSHELIVEKKDLKRSIDVISSNVEMATREGITKVIT